MEEGQLEGGPPRPGLVADAVEARLTRSLSDLESIW